MCSEYYPTRSKEKSERPASANFAHSEKLESIGKEQKVRSRFSAFQKATEWSEGIPPESLRSFFRTFRKPVDLRLPDAKELLEQQTKKISEFISKKESLNNVSNSQFKSC